MAEAIISGLLSQKLLSKNQIFVSDINKQRLVFLSQTYGVKTFESNQEALDSQGPVIIAVKPQHIQELLKEISPKIGERLVISIAAGITVSLLQDGLPEARIIRVMPNTAALVGEAITAISKGDSANDDDLKIAKTVFGAIGKVIEVEEELQNAVTALSGSGPAYFFYLSELLIEAGVKVGLSYEQSRQLSIQTAIGAGELLKADENPQKLRKMVTSPGGTTEAAIKSLEDNSLSDIVEKAVHKAYERAKELSDE